MEVYNENLSVLKVTADELQDINNLNDRYYEDGEMIYELFKFPESWNKEEIEKTRGSDVIMIIEIDS